MQRWISTRSGQSFGISSLNESGDADTKAVGIALIMEPTTQFAEMEYDDGGKAASGKIGWGYLFGYVKEHKIWFFQILLGLLIGSLLQLIFPYLTQSIVDTGINTQNLGFVQIVLAAQLMLLFSQTVVEFIRSRILLHISTRINISLLSGFWAKLLKLTMNFFDSKHPGDIIQRIGDHHRIESFLTGTALNTFFSVFNLGIFSFVLLLQAPVILTTFGRFKLTGAGRFKLTTLSRSKLTTF